jgi:hypothetical protein
MYGRVEVYIHAIFMSVMVTGGCSASNPSYCRPGDTFRHKAGWVSAGMNTVDKIRLSSPVPESSRRSLVVHIAAC